MEEKKLMILQSNYIPWKGFFDSLLLVDEFIIYDEVQYTRSDWRNRNMLITPEGPKWLTIPVKIAGYLQSHQKIKDTKIADPKWNKKHWGFIQSNYKKAPFYKEYREWLEALYLECNEQFLTDINEKFIREFCSFLDIKTHISRSSDYHLIGDRNERLINLCKDVNATVYYSGAAAKNYINEKMFIENKVDLRFFDYSGYKEYAQLFDGFSHAVSIIDMILNLGKETQDYLKHKNRITYEE